MFMGRILQRSLHRKFSISVKSKSLGNMSSADYFFPNMCVFWQLNSTLNL